MISKTISTAPHDQSVTEHRGIQITLPSNFTRHPVGNNQNELSGRFEEMIPAPNKQSHYFTK